MPRIGAHMSIQGGLPKAVDRAALHGCEALQIFTKSSGQWRARPLPGDEIAAFRRRLDETGVRPAVAHASYLINLAASDPVLRQRSIASYAEELDRAEALGLLGVVIHPGTGSPGEPESAGLERIAAALAEVLAARRRQRAMVLLEHTAGMGGALGYRFEHLAWLIERLDGSPRVGVCLDTCHLLAAGYDIRSPEGYALTMRGFGALVGFDRLRVVHVNDSKRPLGSRVDRHAHIGQGEIGLEPFRRLLADRRFARLPMLLETEKHYSATGGRVVLDPLDVMNLDALRRLRAPGRRGAC